MSRMHNDIGTDKCKLFEENIKYVDTRPLVPDKDSYSPYCRPQWITRLDLYQPTQSDLDELIKSTRLEF